MIRWIPQNRMKVFLLVLVILFGLSGVQCCSRAETLDQGLSPAQILDYAGNYAVNLGYEPGQIGYSDKSMTYAVGPFTIVTEMKNGLSYSFAIMCKRFTKDNSTNFGKIFGYVAAGLTGLGDELKAAFDKLNTTMMNSLEKNSQIVETGKYEIIVSVDPEKEEPYMLKLQLKEPLTGNQHLTALSALEVLQRMSLDTSAVIAFTKDTDPNQLIGKEGAYTSKVNFALKSVDPDPEEENSISIDQGGSIEVFSNIEDAIERSHNTAVRVYHYNNELQYEFLCCNALLRLSLEVPSEEAGEIVTAFINAVKLDKDAESVINPLRSALSEKEELIKKLSEEVEEKEKIIQQFQILVNTQASGEVRRDPVESADGRTLRELFPDKGFAIIIRNELGLSSIDNPVTQEQLDSIGSLKIRNISDSVYSLEGISHLRSLYSLELMNSVMTIAAKGGYGSSSSTSFQFTGLPSEMALLTNLSSIKIHNARLTKFPEVLRCFPNLTDLQLSFCDYPELPSWIGELTSLRNLDIHGCHVSFLPDTIADLTNLQTLDCSDTDLVSLPESISRLCNLRELDCQDTFLTKLPKGIGELSKLNKLWLNDTNISEIPVELCSLKTLTELRISECRITSLPKEMSSMDSLQSVDVSYNPITNDGFPDELRRTDHIKFNLKGTKVE